jgi:hypothetical protein
MSFVTSRRKRVIQRSPSPKRRSPSPKRRSPSPKRRLLLTTKDDAFSVVPIHPPYLPPPITVRGDSFTIYGEIHNENDNLFYKELYRTFTETDRILLEKTTDPGLLQLDKLSLQIIPDIGMYLNKIGGSEWIYTMGLLEGKSFEPIDIRVECGYPSKMEILTLKEMALQEPSDFIEFFIKTMKNISKHKERLNRPGIKERFESFIPVLKLQSTTFLKYLQENQIDEETLDNIIMNFKLLCVLLVDAHIMDLITKNTKKPAQDRKHLHIFVGARHALNLYECFQIQGIKLDIIKTEKGKQILPVVVKR